MQECGGAHNVHTLCKPVIRSVPDAHRKHEERKAQEKEEIETMERGN